MSVTKLAVAGLGLLALAGCRGAEQSTYQETRLETRPAARAPEAAAASEEFSNYSDEAADRYLTRIIAERIDAEIRREDAEREEAARRAAAQPVQVIERTVYPSYVEPGYYQRASRAQTSPLPWNTILYGTLGGVIGHQSGHRDEGIAIGAGLGLLYDVMRWHSW